MLSELAFQKTRVRAAHDPMPLLHADRRSVAPIIGSAPACSALNRFMRGWAHSSSCPLLIVA